MKVISIQIGHNATVALAEDGAICGVLSQEKCDNIKNSSVFPHDAITALLAELGWRADEIDRVLIASINNFPKQGYVYQRDANNNYVDKSPVIRFAKFLRDSFVGKAFPFVFRWLRNKRLASILARGRVELFENLERAGLGNCEVEFVEHHLCHARAAYHSAPDALKAEKGLVLTIDGAGDDLCATVSIAHPDGRFERIASTDENYSPGYIYSTTTRFLGMKALEHEYKVMGLAPYAKEEYMLETYERIFKPMAWVSKSNPLTFETAIKAPQFYEYLAKHAVGERFDNIAAALQHLTETLVIEWIGNCIKQTGIRTIFTGGGLFMNVKLNKRIQEMPEIDQVFFMPSCGDESNPIGACYDYFQRQGVSTKPLNNLYLGVSYSNDDIKSEIARLIDDEAYEVTYHEDMEAKIASLLHEQEIVARFKGPCEWGARSLGNRAILAHPSYMESFYAVNDYIKSRDFWMPFAPSMLDHKAGEYLTDYHPEKAQAPFMITAFEASELGKRSLKAALHQGDHTLRPQVVTAEAAPSYHRLISLFADKSSVGAVLNTSFNLHGYPLVSTPEQAVFTMENSALRYLALENYLIRKKDG